MRSIKKYVGSNDRLYGKKFKHVPYNTVYTILKVPDDWSYITNETHCWVQWNDDGLIRRFDYEWESVRENIKEGIWVLI